MVNSTLLLSKRSHSASVRVVGLELHAQSKVPARNFLPYRETYFRRHFPHEETTDQYRNEEKASRVKATYSN